MKLEIVCDEFHISHEGEKETNEQTFEILLLKASCLSLLPISFIIPGLLTLGCFWFSMLPRLPCLTLTK